MVLWIAASVLLLAGGLLIIRMSMVSEPVPDFLEEDDFDPIRRNDSFIPEAVNNYLDSLGVDISETAVWAIVTIIALGGVALFVTQPPKLAIVGFAAVLLVINIVLKSMGEARKRKLLEQLPSFLSQVSRRLSAGVSVEHAFTDSMESLEAPLSTSMQRVLQRVGLGLELHQAFEREARNSNLQEFHILATAVRINEQFGGSIRSILEDIVEILHLDDLGKRELRAQTGETRVTAVVLSLLPIAIASWLFIKNPKFLLNMWEDSTGQFLLIGSVVMLITGILVLWRMVRSI